MNAISLRVHVFTGTPIEDATREMCLLAKRIGLMVEADFNGVLVWARPGNHYEDLVKAYHEQLGLDRNTNYRIASVPVEP